MCREFKPYRRILRGFCHLGLHISPSNKATLDLRFTKMPKRMFMELGEEGVLALGLGTAQPTDSDNNEMSTLGVGEGEVWEEHVLGRITPMRRWRLFKKEGSPKISPQNFLCHHLLCPLHGPADNLLRFIQSRVYCSRVAVSFP